MKRIFIILIFLITQKYSFSSDWITFVPAKTKDFSESFKKRMIKDLYPKLYKILDDSISEADFDFALTIGETNMEMTERNGNAFISALLSIEFEDATQYPVTICWTSPDFKNKLDIHKSDISNKNVVFNWCDDFPKEKILGRLKPWKNLSKEVSGYKFNIEYYLFSWPWAVVFFDFDTVPSEQTLNAIDFEFKKYSDSNATVRLTHLRKSEKDYIIDVYCNTTGLDYTEKDFEYNMNKLNALILNINLNKEVINLKRIRLK